MRCFITGATGFVGSHLAEACRARGWDVTCLIRNPRRSEWLTGLDVDLVVGDLDAAAALARGVAGADVVFHVGGLVKARRETDYRRVNEGGTQNVVAACLAARDRPRRLVVVSSQAAAGPSVDGRPIDETTPPRPISPYGASKLWAEVVARAAAGELNVTIVRPPTIYGPRDREGALAYRLIRLGIRPATPLRALSIIHVGDLVEALIAASVSQRAIGRTYFVANPRPIAVSALGEIIATALGTRLRTINVPVVVLVAAGLLSELVGRVSGHPSVFDRHKAAELTQRAWVCSSERATSDLGWQARVDLAAGIAQTVRWYRANRRL